MTRERKLAIKMWQEIVKNLKKQKKYLIFFVEEQMVINNNGKYWIVYDSSGKIVALFKSIVSLADYVIVTKQVSRMRRTS